MKAQKEGANEQPHQVVRLEDSCTNTEPRQVNLGGCKNPVKLLSCSMKQSVVGLEERRADKNDAKDGQTRSSRGRDTLTSTLFFYIVSHRSLNASQLHLQVKTLVFHATLLQQHVFCQTAGKGK